MRVVWLSALTFRVVSFFWHFCKKQHERNLISISNLTSQTQSNFMSNFHSVVLENYSKTLLFFCFFWEEGSTVLFNYGCCTWIKLMPLWTGWWKYFPTIIQRNFRILHWLFGSYHACLLVVLNMKRCLICEPSPTKHWKCIFSTARKWSILFSGVLHSEVVSLSNEVLLYSQSYFIKATLSSEVPLYSQSYFVRKYHD